MWRKCLLKGRKEEVSLVNAIRDRRNGPSEDAMHRRVLIPGDEE